MTPHHVLTHTASSGHCSSRLGSVGHTAVAGYELLADAIARATGEPYTACGWRATFYPIQMASAGA
jgi:hypothetical protein